MAQWFYYWRKHAIKFSCQAVRRREIHYVRRGKVKVYYIINQCEYSLVSLIRETAPQISYRNKEISGKETIILKVHTFRHTIHHNVYHAV